SVIMKTEKNRWRPSPALVVMITALIVVAGPLLVGWLSARRYRVTARVEITDPAPFLERPISQPLTNDAFLPDGEVARLASRVPEATGLLMGLTMLAVSEQMSGRHPASAESLTTLMAARGLFPPGLTQTSAKGVLASERATIYVRYRAVPFGIEAVSVGREKTDGPAVIARLVTGGVEDSGAALLVAKKVENITMPRPFAPMTEIAALGWSVETLRERSFAPQEIDQLNEWAKQYAGTSK